MQDLTDQLFNQMMLYNKDIKEKVEAVSQECIKELVEKTKQTAPVGNTRRRHFRDSITYSPQKKALARVSYLWHVKAPDYRLAHLLENGHAKVNGGRVEGTHFISKANDEVQKKYEEKIGEILRGD